MLCMNTDLTASISFPILVAGVYMNTCKDFTYTISLNLKREIDEYIVDDRTFDLINSDGMSETAHKRLLRA